MKVKITLTFFLICFIATDVFSQEVFYGTNNYIEYQKGTLPIVLSVPHGGDLDPAGIPNRTCNNPVFATDSNTIETALAIKNALFEQTGCYPHIIICHLKRSKLDCNRNLSDGACGNPQASTAWNEFQGFITTAQNHANLSSSNNAIFIDVHGHGNPIQRIELGYLLYDDELALPDATLNTTTYLNYSSIKNLALNNQNSYTHAQLLRGPKSFGTLLGDKGFPSVPSSQIPFPGTTSNYFSGGYITANHTCYAPNNLVNGFQMELNFTGIRDTPLNRQKFADSLAIVIDDYWFTHRNIQINACSTLNIIKPQLKSLHVYPNPLNKSIKLIRIEGLEPEQHKYTIYTSVGQVHSSGYIHNDAIILAETFSSGLYFLIIKQEASGEIYNFKIVSE